MKCPYCSKEIREDAFACHHCGKAIESISNPNQEKLDKKEKKDFVRINGLDICINVDGMNRLFYPGDVVQAEITIRSEKEIKARELSASLVFSHNYIYKYEGPWNLTMDNETTKESPVATEILKKKDVIPAKFNESYQVKFQIPKNANPTYIGKIIKSHWLIRVSDGNLGKWNREIQIKIAPSGIFVDPFKKQIIFINMIGVGGFTPKQYNISLWLPRLEWVEGETINGKVLINLPKEKSKKPIPIQLLNACLICKEIVPEEEGNSATTYQEDIKLVDKAMINIDETVEFPFALTIPKHDRPSFHTDFSCLEWSVNIHEMTIFKFEQKIFVYPSQSPTKSNTQDITSEDPIDKLCANKSIKLFYKNTVEAWSSNGTWLSFFFAKHGDVHLLINQVINFPFRKFVENYCMDPNSLIPIFLDQCKLEQDEYLVVIVAGWFVLTNKRLFQKDGEKDHFREFPLDRIKKYSVHEIFLSGDFTIEIDLVSGEKVNIHHVKNAVLPELLNSLSQFRYEALKDSIVTSSESSKEDAVKSESEDKQTVRSYVEQAKAEKQLPAELAEALQPATQDSQPQKTPIREQKKAGCWVWPVLVIGGLLFITGFCLGSSIVLGQITPSVTGQSVGEFLLGVSCTALLPLVIGSGMLGISIYTLLRKRNQPSSFQSAIRTTDSSGSISNGEVKVETISPSSSSSSLGSINYGEVKKNESAMWIFACYDHDRVSAMSMFSNTAHYFSEEHAIDTVRSRFSINENRIVKFVKPDIWNAPNAVATPTSFNIDMQRVNSSILKYLESFNYKKSDVLNALNVSSAIPNPKLGILLICVDLR